MDQRDRLWQDWLGADYSSRYYARLSRLYEVTEGGIRIAILVCSSAAFGTLISSKAASVAPWFALGSALLSAISLIAQLGKKADRCTDLHFRFASLADEYERLWDNQQAPLDADSWKRLRDVQRKCEGEAARLINLARYAKLAQEEVLRERRLDPAMTL